MNKDWFATFLRLWALGSIDWIGVGFYLLPASYQQPLFGRGQELYIGTIYDVSAIDYDVLWKFLVVLGVPNIVLLVVFVIAGYQHIRNKPAKRAEPIRA